MQPRSGQLLSLARTTIADPKDGARIILGLQLARSALVQMAVLVTIISVLLSAGEQLLSRDQITQTSEMLIISPLAIVTVQLGILAMIVIAAYRIGRAFGGSGDFDGALALMVWLQVMNVFLQAFSLFLVVVFALPSFALLLASMVVSIWLAVNFLAVLHGFQSLWKVFGVVLASLFALSIGIRMVLGLFIPVIGGL